MFYKPFIRKAQSAHTTITSYTTYKNGRLITES
jgi:hypothetical protein